MAASLVGVTLGSWLQGDRPGWVTAQVPSAGLWTVGVGTRITALAAHKAAARRENRENTL